MVTIVHARVQEVERLVDELDTLLARSRLILERVGLHSRARGLAGWGHSYRHGLRYGLLTGDKPHKEARGWQAGMSDRLKLEAGEGEDDERPVRGSKVAPRSETEHFIQSASTVIRSAFAARHISLILSWTPVRSPLDHAILPVVPEEATFYTADAR